MADKSEAEIMAQNQVIQHWITTGFAVAMTFFYLLTYIFAGNTYIFIIIGIICLFVVFGLSFIDLKLLTYTQAKTARTATILTLGVFGLLAFSLRYRFSSQKR